MQCNTITLLSAMNYKLNLNATSRSLHKLLCNSEPLITATMSYKSNCAATIGFPTDIIIFKI